MKEEINSFDVRALVSELQVLVDGFLDKAYQPTREEVLLRFRVKRAPTEAAVEAAPEPAVETAAEPTEAPEGEAEEGGEEPVEPAAESSAGRSRRDLLIRVGKGLFFTANPPEAPKQPPAFAMALRKHVGGARVLAVRQHGFDRIVEVELAKKEGIFTLVLEFFGDGNVILVQGGRIVLPLIHQSWATRDVRPGREFQHPPARADPFRLTYDTFRPRFLASQADAVRTLATEFDIGPLYAEEVCARAGVPKNKPVMELGEGEVEALFLALRGILDRFEAADFEPMLVMKGDTKVDASPIPLALHERLASVPQPSYSAALDALWGRGPKERPVVQEDPRLAKWREEKARIERQLAQQQAALKKFQVEEKEARAKGDLLYGHFDLVNRVRDIILKASKELGWAEVQNRLKAGKKAGNPEAAAVDTLNPNEGWILLALPNLEGKTDKVRFELTKTVQENAEDFYDKVKKMREKQEGANTALQITLGKLAEMEKSGVALVEQLTAAAERPPPTKRFWFEGYRWFLTSEGNLVMGGRDATTNDKLIKKHLDDTDRYVHADLNGAPSCVVKPNAEGKITEKALQEAGQFAAVMSRAWIHGLAQADAYWVTPLQVSKTPQPGEFLAKGAFIIRGKRNFMQARLRAAVGEITHEGSRKIMGGPPDAVLARAKRYVLLEPGDRDRNKLAAELAKAFHVPVEEIQAVMPPGDVRVVEAKGIEVA